MFSRVSLRTAIICAIACSLPLSFQASAAGQGKPNAKHDVKSNRLIVRFKDNVSFETADNVLKNLERRQREKPEFVRETVNRGIVLKFRKAKERSEWEDIKQWLKSTDTLSYVEVDELLQPVNVTPNDAYFQYQWPLTEATGGINILPSWEQGISGSGSVVAVLDTGYRPHIDLMPNLLPGYDMIADSFTGNDGNGRDSDASDPGNYILAGECGSTSNINSSWHGTHVAGTVAAVMNNQTGIAGVAYNAKVQPVRVLGKCGGYTSDIADGILWASGNEVPGTPPNPTPAKVLNLSLGGTGNCSYTLQRAIDRAVANNSVVVVAAGNSSSDAQLFNPANCNNVISVAASNREGAKATYTNTGAVVDISAPGGSMYGTSYDGILSTLNTGTTTPANDTYAFFQGTSMAAPHVAGVAALMQSANPELTPAQIESIIKESARPFPVACADCGAGIVDASAAVSIAISLGSGVDEPDTGEPENPDNNENPVNTLPTASFTASINDLSVALTDTSTDNEGPLTSWRWNFGDNTTSDNQNPVHTYAATGTYKITLTVTDSNGATHSSNQIISVVSPIKNLPVLSVTGMTPNTMKIGSRTRVTISGNGFTNGMTISFANGGGRIPGISNVVVTDSETMTATIRAKGPRRRARTQTWDVVITSPEGSLVTLQQGLTITP